MEAIPKSLTEQRSEEVSYIIEHMPRKFGMVVTAVVLFLVVLMGLFGWLIRYPEILIGEINVSAENASIKISSNSNGKLDVVYGKNGDNVVAGQVIGMIKNGARLNEVQLLDSLLQKVNIQQISFAKHRHFFPENLIVGELNTKYFAFLNALYEYLDYSVEQPFDKKKTIGQTLVITHRNLRNDVLKQTEILRMRMETARSINARDSQLLKGRIISKSDYEKSLLNKIAAEQEFEAISKDLKNNSYQIEEANSKLEEIAIQKSEKERELRINLYNSFHELKERILEWKHSYVLAAPVTGRLEYVGFIKKEDFVQAGQELFNIIPEQNAAIGQMFLPEHGAGKVKVGQAVIVKLDNYPFNEFGSVKGRVETVSLVTNQQIIPAGNPANGGAGAQTKVSGYLITVSFPRGLVTNYGAPLDFHFGARGSGEIVIENKRLIQRLFDNLKYKLKDS